MTVIFYETMYTLVSPLYVFRNHSDIHFLARRVWRGSLNLHEPRASHPSTFGMTQTKLELFHI